MDHLRKQTRAGSVVAGSRKPVRPKDVTSMLVLLKLHWPLLRLLFVRTFEANSGLAPPSPHLPPLPSLTSCSFAPLEPTRGWPLLHLPSSISCSFAPSKPTRGWPPSSPPLLHLLFVRIFEANLGLAPPSPLVRSHLRSQLGAGPSFTSPSSPSCSFAPSKPTRGWPLLHLLFVRAFAPSKST